MARRRRCRVSCCNASADNASRRATSPRPLSQSRASTPIASASAADDARRDRSSRSDPGTEWPDVAKSNSIRRRNSLRAGWAGEGFEGQPDAPQRDVRRPAPQEVVDQSRGRVPSRRVQALDLKLTHPCCGKSVKPCRQCLSVGTCDPGEWLLPPPDGLLRQQAHRMEVVAPFHPPGENAQVVGHLPGERVLPLLPPEPCPPLTLRVGVPD